MTKDIPEGAVEIAARVFCCGFPLASHPDANTLEGLIAKGRCRAPACKCWEQGKELTRAALLAALPHLSPPQGESGGWQHEVLEWAVDKFGEIARDPRERAMRFIEEALELGQTQGVSDCDVAALVGRVYTRPPGDAAKEIAQAGLTLEALAENIGHKLAPLIRQEIARINSIPKEEWQRRHAAKIAVGAALPANSLNINQRGGENGE